MSSTEDIANDDSTDTDSTRTQSCQTQPHRPGLCSRCANVILPLCSNKIALVFGVGFMYLDGAYGNQVVHCFLVAAIACFMVALFYMPNGNSCVEENTAQRIDWRAPDEAETPAVVVLAEKPPAYDTVAVDMSAEEPPPYDSLTCGVSESQADNFRVQLCAVHQPPSVDTNDGGDADSVIIAQQNLPDAQ